MTTTRTTQQMTARTASMTLQPASTRPAWQQHFDRLWARAGVPPEGRPVVSLRGSAADVEARRWAAHVAGSR